jgi:hypothetical protein
MSKILIVGGSGLIGNYIAPLLSEKHEVIILSRKKRADDGKIKFMHWDPDNGYIEEEALNCDIIINLAGEGIAEKRWTAERKKSLVDSRVFPLGLIEKKLKELNKEPRLFIGAAAIGYYGHREDEVLTESSPLGQGFLAECSKLWEEASHRVGALCERYALMRIGIVLSSKGGALPELLMTSKLGFLSYFGAMYYSWIHIHDIYGIIDAIIKDEKYHGIINAVSPEPISNKSMVQKMATALGGKLTIPAPAFGIKLALGEMSDVVLNSTRVVPSFLHKQDYKFHFSDVEIATKDLIKRSV